MPRFRVETRTIPIPHQMRLLRFKRAVLVGVIRMFITLFQVETHTHGELTILKRMIP
jgi:hypothetical protein